MSVYSTHISPSGTDKEALLRIRYLRCRGLSASLLLRYIRIRYPKAKATTNP